MSQLLPEGMQLRDAPYRLQHAIKTGLMFIGFDELMPEDRPPRAIWLNVEKLTEHFDNVKRRQKDTATGGRVDDIEDPVQNNALDMLIVGG